MIVFTFVNRTWRRLRMRLQVVEVLKVVVVSVASSVIVSTAGFVVLPVQNLARLILVVGTGTAGRTVQAQLMAHLERLTYRPDDSHGLALKKKKRFNK